MGHPRKIPGHQVLILLEISGKAIELEEPWIPCCEMKVLIQKSDLSKLIPPKPIWSGLGDQVDFCCYIQGSGA